MEMSAVGPLSGHHRAMFALAFGGTFTSLRLKFLRRPDERTAHIVLNFPVANLFDPTVIDDDDL